jgi:DNA (cytosine-5)-methyltransferase 1
MIIDLFAGAGGLSTGLEMAGFEVGLAVEMEETYCETYRTNHPSTPVLNADIRDLDLKDVEKMVGKPSGKGIVGGPPCMGFSTVGNRREDDPRNSLVHRFIDWVAYFRPEFYVMENVNGILSMSNGNVKDAIVKKYTRIGYSCCVRKLLAADYGVPQMRERVFFIGFRESTLVDVSVRKVKKPKDYLTVKDALSDILDLAPTTPKKFLSSKESPISYPNGVSTDYQAYLREGSEGLFEHVAPNHSGFVKERISHIAQGENHSSLPKIYQLKGGYPNIYGRLHLDRPADTITGNCGCVSAPGRFIHPTQDRAISVREAARLQSYPDSYRFFGTTRDMYKQVGNSVPPLLAKALGDYLKKVVDS